MAPIRFTLDLGREQHRFLRLFSNQYQLENAFTLRVLLYLLETDLSFAEKVIQELCSPTSFMQAAPANKTRFTLDLNAAQHQFLKKFAIQNGIQASRLLRVALYLLEGDVRIREMFLKETFEG